MAYLVWDFLPFEGAGYTRHETWDGVVEHLNRMLEPHQVDCLLSGKTKLLTIGSKEEHQWQIGVTNDFITGPIT